MAAARGVVLAGIRLSIALGENIDYIYQDKLLTDRNQDRLVVHSRNRMLQVIVDHCRQDRLARARFTGNRKCLLLAFEELDQVRRHPQACGFLAFLGEIGNKVGDIGQNRIFR